MVCLVGGRTVACKNASPTSEEMRVPTAPQKPNSSGFVALLEMFLKNCNMICGLRLKIRSRSVSMIADRINGCLLSITVILAYFMRLEEAIFRTITIVVYRVTIRRKALYS